MKGGRVRIIGIADTDSYVKWSAALLGSLPSAAEAELLVVETPLVVSATQQAAATAGSGLDPSRVRRIAFAQVAKYVADAAPDAVLIAARGPVVRVLARLIGSLSPRPVIVTGLPGISIPATSAALIHRTQCDLFVLHSTREIREFTALAERRGFVQRFALSRLPFARSGSAAAHAETEGGTDLVFAAQAIVPRSRPERMAIVNMLIRAAETDPSRRVVVKLRAVKGEHQTHRERDGYPELLAATGREMPENLVISTAPMASALHTAEGLVTVSSTAVIEAVALGVPAIVIDTFGVSDELINPVFVGSDLFGGEAEIVEREFRTALTDWVQDNYFHAASADDWLAQLEGLVAERRRGALAPKPPLARRGGHYRDRWERAIIVGRRERSVAETALIAVGVPFRQVVRVYQRAIAPYLIDPRVTPEMTQR